MNLVRLAAYTTLTMLAFAGNSLFCRIALKETSIDSASFISVRLLSGALMLWLLMRWQRQAPLAHGSWRSAGALFIYAAALSFAYRSIAWGVYSMFGRGQPDPAATTAGNFLRAAPLIAALSLLALPWLTLDARGVVYAVLSGALTSALGYVLWYRVLQHMRVMTASTVQLSAPVLATIGGILLLDEVLTREMLIASVLILGGISLVLRYGKR